MLISEAARCAGVSRDTVRLYTRLGLVSCAQRQAGSRAYADYDEEAVELIKNVKVAQSIGFSLSELLPIATLYVAGELDDDRQRAFLRAKLAEIEERQRKLRQMSEFLQSKLSHLELCQETAAGSMQRRTRPGPRSQRSTTCQETAAGSMQRRA